MYIRDMTYEGMPVKNINIYYRLDSIYDKFLFAVDTTDDYIVTYTDGVFCYNGIVTTVGKFYEFIVDNYKKIYNMCSYYEVVGGKRQHRFYIHEPTKLDLMLRKCLKFEEIKPTVDLIVNETMIKSISDTFIIVSDDKIISLCDWYRVDNSDLETEYFRRNADIDGIPRDYLIKVSVENKIEASKIIAKALLIEG